MKHEDLCMKVLLIDSRKKHKIFTDSLRQDILSVIRQSTTPQSVKMIADALNIAHAKIHYHVKKLSEIDALKLAKTDEINGITVKYYELAFDKVNFLPNEHTGYHGMIFSNQLSEAIINKFDIELNKILKCSSTIDQAIENQPVYYGIQVFSEALYLTHEERLDLVKLIEGYLDKHKIKENGIPYATKTNFFCTIYDDTFYQVKSEE